ncbi:FAD-dependent oxidoreductase [Micromonospora sp. 067-2]|uniref:FAD-dependent oxidoreductase n=1 Tax=Micromonospora sp. 067-2 TaxID=2789270 RepID=UPI00397A7D30
MTARRATVLGAGVFGLCIAHELAVRGWRVQVVHRDPLDNSGASTAESRILRTSYGADDWYTRSAWRSRELWCQFGRAAGRTVLAPTGVLLLGTLDQWAHDTMQVARRVGVPLRQVQGAEARDQFPWFTTNPADHLLFEPSGAVLLAREAIRAVATCAVDRGVRLRRADVFAVDGQPVTDGRPLDGDVTVWAVGPGLPVLFPGLTSARVVAQDSMFLDPPASWRRDQPPPAWVDRTAEWYGVPAVGSGGVKVVADQTVAPDAEAVQVDPHPYLRQRVPGLRDAPVRRWERCRYVEMPDEHFLLDRHPADPTVWLAGGDNGHGFKHGPAWAAFVCDAVEERAEVPFRFRIR